MISDLDSNVLYRLQKRLKEVRVPSSDFTIGSILMWGDWFDIRIKEYVNSFIFENVYQDKGKTYSVLAGEDDYLEVIDYLYAQARSNNRMLVLSSITENEKSRLSDHYGQRIAFDENRDWSDYVYLATDLKELKGNKYHKKKNQVNQFIKNHSDFEFLRELDIQEAKEFIGKWAQEADKSSALFNYESSASENLLRYIDQFHFCSCGLRVNGNLIGMSIGELINDSLYVHIEKADIFYSGVYQMINREFIRHFADDRVRYVNREEDIGDEGLRKSKLSYHPDFMIKKYFAFIE